MTVVCNPDNQLDTSLDRVPALSPPSTTSTSATNSESRNASPMTLSSVVAKASKEGSDEKIAGQESSVSLPGLQHVIGSLSLPLGEFPDLGMARVFPPKHDSKLLFDEAAHRYTLAENGKECMSVTTLLDNVFPHFDPDDCLMKHYSRWQTPTHPKYALYGGKTGEEIKQMWEEKSKKARDLGTDMHKQIENMFQGRPAALDASTMSGLRKFLRMHSASLGLGVQGVEVQMVDPKLRLAGTADLVARGLTGGLTLVDWKRTDKDVRSDSFAFGGHCGAPLHPEHEIPANTFYRYALQLNLYKRLLEENYDCGAAVEKLLVVQLHPDLPDAMRVVELPVLPEAVDCLLRWRSQMVADQDAPHHHAAASDSHSLSARSQPSNGIDAGAGNGVETSEAEANEGGNKVEGAEEIEQDIQPGGTVGASADDRGMATSAVMEQETATVVALLAEKCSLRERGGAADAADDDDDEEWT